MYMYCASSFFFRFTEYSCWKSKRNNSTYIIARKNLYFFFFIENRVKKNLNTVLLGKTLNLQIQLKKKDDTKYFDTITISPISMLIVLDARTFQQ